MRLETGKTYLTREGKKVQIASVFNHKKKGEMPEFYIGISEKVARPYDTEGNFCQLISTMPAPIMIDHRYDITGEAV